jgi:hypothetical protein
MEPAIATPHGRAWRMEADLEHAPATLACWLLHRPGSNPVAVDYFALSLVHLRPHAKYGQPFKARESSTHELIIAPLHPNHAPDPSDTSTIVALGLHVTTVIQLDNLDDHAARVIVDRLVDALAHGPLNPGHARCCLQWLDRACDEWRTMN